MRGFLHVFATLDPSMRRLLAAWALLGFGYFGIQAVLQNLYLLRLGYGTEFIGLLTGSGQLFWALCALPAGAFGRRFGLRAAIATSWTLSGIANAMFLLVELTPREWWTPWLFFWWSLSWVGASLNSVNNIPYVIALTSAEERNHAFSAQQGVLGLMAFVGGIVAGLLPGWIAGLLGTSDPVAPYRYALWVAPVAYLLTVFMVRGLRPVAQARYHSEDGQAVRAPLGLFGLFVLVVFLQTAGDGGLRAFLNVYLDQGLGVQTAQIGAAMGAAQLLPVLMAFAAPLVLRRFGAGVTYGLATLGMALAVALVGSVPHWLAAAGGYMGVMTMFSLVVPARNIFSQQIVPPRWGTTSSALITIGLATGWALTAAAGGYIIARVGFGGFFQLCAALAALSAVLIMGFLRRRVP